MLIRYCQIKDTMEPKLLIYTNKQAYKKICSRMLILVIFLSFILFFVRNALGAGYLCTFIQGFLFMVIVAMSIMFIYALYRVNRKVPMAIINSSGIWIKQFGIIPWKNVHEINTYLSIESIGIQVRDTAMLSNQATIAGKLIILESKILNCPTIVIDNIELDNQTVLSFAKQFIEEAKQL